MQIFCAIHSHFSHFIGSHVADANTKSTATFLPSLPVALLQTNLVRIGHIGHSPAPVALVSVLGAGRFEDGRGLRLGHFVKEGEVCYVFARWRQRDHGGELVAPENLIRQVGGADLTGGGGRLNCSAHDHQQLEVCQLWICPAPTWWRLIRWEEQHNIEKCRKKRQKRKGMNRKEEEKKINLKIHLRVFNHW